MHLNLRISRKEQTRLVDRYIAAELRLYAVEKHLQRLDALDTGDRKDSLTDTRVEDRAAERPALPVFSTFQRVKVIFNGLLDALLDVSKVCVVGNDDVGFNFYSLISGLNHIQLCGHQPALIEIGTHGSQGALAGQRRRIVAN